MKVCASFTERLVTESREVWVEDDLLRSIHHDGSAGYECTVMVDFLERKYTMNNEFEV